MLVRCVRSLIAVSAGIFSTGVALAESADWLTIDESGGCDAARLPDLVQSTMVGERRRDVEVAVTISQGARGYETTIVVRSVTETSGVTTLHTRSCEEALDASAVVLALALEQEPQHAAEPAPASLDANPNPPRQSETIRRRAPSKFTKLRPTAQPVPADRPGSLPGMEHSSLSTIVGVDTGTLASHTGYARLALATELGPIVIRGGGRYGFPDVSIDEGERLRRQVIRQFASLDIAGCYRIGVIWSLSSCGGVEVVAARTGIDLRADSGTSSHSETALHVAGVFTAVGSIRGSAVEPQVELAGATTFLGRSGDASALGLRAGLGAAVTF